MTHHHIQENDKQREWLRDHFYEFLWPNISQFEIATDQDKLFNSRELLQLPVGTSEMDPHVPKLRTIRQVGNYEFEWKSFFFLFYFSTSCLTLLFIIKRFKNLKTWR